MDFYVESRTGRERDPMLDQMFTQRHDIFVRRLRWDLKCSDNYEKDEFDRIDTQYLLIMQNNSDLLHGSLRILPSIGPHLLSEYFSDLCKHEVPRGHDVWEVSRMCISPKIRRPEIREYLIDLLAANLTEIALLNDVSKLTFVVGTSLLQRVIGMAWDISPLGLPQPCGRELVTAFAVDISPTTLRDLTKQCQKSAALCAEALETQSTTRLGAA